MGWRIMVGAAAILFTPDILHAVTSDISDVGGIHRLTLTAGPNFISAPLHRAPAFRGTVATVAAGSISFSGSPGWSINQFGPRDGYPQFIALLRQDVSATPGSAGDWWPVTANTADTLTVITRGEDLTTILANGDVIEIRQLTSFKDLFGTGASLRLNKDSNGSPSPSEEDVVYLVSGTSFSSEIFYHDGSLVPEGYYVDGTGPFDGSTLTIGPDQPIMVFRKTGSPALNLLTTGQVHTTQLTHYLKTGANPVGTGFPVDSPIGSSGLLASGWKADSNGSPSVAEEDVLYTVLGSSFSDEVFYHDGSVAPAGWYADGVINYDFPLSSSQGLVLFVLESAGLHWRQTVPF